MSDRTCSVDGCATRLIARGLCTKHYQRWLKGSKLRDGTNTCTVCGTLYYPHLSTQLVCSRKCHGKLPHVVETMREYGARPNTRERKNAARRIATSPDPKRQRIKNLRNNLARYGLTLAEHQAMLDEQQGKCLLCGAPPNPNGVRAASRLHVDHDHVTGMVRALLCNGCNRGIGYLRDSPEFLRVAADYIESYRNEI